LRIIILSPLRIRRDKGHNMLNRINSAKKGGNEMDKTPVVDVGDRVNVAIA